MDSRGRHPVCISQRRAQSVADEASAGGEGLARGALARVLVHALAGYAVVELCAAQMLQRLLTAATQQAVAYAQQPGVRRVGAAYLRYLTASKAVGVIRAAYGFRRLQIQRVVCRAEAVIGQKQQDSEICPKSSVYRLE